MTNSPQQLHSRGTLAFTAPCSSVSSTGTTLLSSRKATHCYSFLPSTSTSTSTPMDINNMDFTNFPSPSAMILSSSTTVQESPSFEAVAPDASILIGLGIVVALSIISSFVWANEVVPVSRTKLALSKRNGEVKQYLDELKQSASIDDVVDSNKSSSQMATMNDEMGEQLTTGEVTTEKTTSATSGGRDFERWLFTDWLENNKSSGKGGRKKEPALPILKSAKWNSGDNPVLVTFALMMVGVVVASVTERVF